MPQVLSQTIKLVTVTVDSARERSTFKLPHVVVGRIQYLMGYLTLLTGGWRKHALAALRVKSPPPAGP